MFVIIISDAPTQLMDEYIVDVGDAVLEYDSDGTEHYIADHSTAIMHKYVANNAQICP